MKVFSFTFELCIEEHSQLITWLFVGSAYKIGVMPWKGDSGGNSGQKQSEGMEVAGLHIPNHVLEFYID